MIRRLRSQIAFARIAFALLAGLLLAGCDKCGNRVKFNAPSLPDACGENANPAR